MDPTSITPEMLESMRFYLWILADRTLTNGLKHKVSPSDVVQQTLMEAYRDASGFAGKSREELRGWLRSILIHNVRNAERSFRTDKRSINREAEHAYEASHTLAVGKSPSSMAAYSEEFSLLEKALSQLPEVKRLAIEYRSIQQLSFAEIGEKLDRSSEAARKLWFRAISELQAKMAELR